MTRSSGSRLRARAARPAGEKSGLSIVTSASGAHRRHGLGGLADAAEQVRQPRQHLGDAHHRQFLHREAARQALRRHCRPADAARGRGRRRSSARSRRSAPRRAGRPTARPRPGKAAPPSSRHQARAPRGRGRRHRRRRPLPRDRGSSPRRPRPPRRRGRPRRRRATVSGPIAGRSTRRSWPGFGPLKSTPLAPAGSGRKPRPVRATKSSSASVPWIDSSPRQMPLRHHRRLTDVGRAECRDDGGRARGVGAVAVRRRRAATGRPAAASRSAAGSRAPRSSRKPSASKTPATSAKRRSRRRRACRASSRGRQPQHRQVEAQRPQLRAGRCRRRRSRRRSRPRAGRAKSRPGFSKAARQHRMAGEPVERHALEDDDAVGPAAPGAVLGDQPRQRAAAGDDGEAVGHACSVRGTVKDRDDSAVTKATISSHQRIVRRGARQRGASALLQRALALEHLAEGGAQAVDVVARGARGASVRRGSARRGARARR